MVPPGSFQILTGPPKVCGPGHEGQGDGALEAFLAAVRTHLESPAAAAVAGHALLEAARVVHLALEPEGEAAIVETLRANPVLLASFFQNADRLDTSRPPGARIARSILRAVHDAVEMEDS